MRRAAGLGIALSLACSGSGGGKAASEPDPALPVRGSVTLPAGSTLQLADLTVMGSQQAAPIGAGGAFTATQPGTGPAMVAVADAAGNPVLLGHVDAAEATTTVRLDATSTAVALLFQSLRAWSAPPGQWKRILQLIAASPEAAQLAAVVEQRLAANPSALSAGDAALEAALASATEALDPAAATSPAAAAARPAAQRAAAASASTVNLLKVDGVNPQSGLTVAPNPTGQGFTITNELRRHVTWFVYRTGYEDQGGVQHPVEPWELLQSDHLMATTAIGGTINALLDVATGNTAFVPVSTAPIVPPLLPSSAQKTIYKVVAAGSGWNAFIPDPLRTSPLRPAWDDAVRKMDDLEFIKEMAIPALFAFLPADVIATASGKEWAAAAVDISGLVIAASADYAVYREAGNYGLALAAFSKALAGTPGLREDVMKTLQRRLPRLATGAGGACLGWAAKLDAALAIVDKAIARVDLFTVFKDLSRSSPLVQWDVTIASPRVRMVPSPAEVRKDAALTVTAVLGGITGDTFEYHWTIPGTHGRLRGTTLGGDLVTGLDLTTNGPTVQYLPEGLVHDGDVEVLSLSVFQIEATDGGTRRTDLGQAQLVITIRAPDHPLLHQGVVGVPYYFQMPAHSERNSLRYYIGVAFKTAELPREPTSRDAIVHTNGNDPAPDPALHFSPPVDGALYFPLTIVWHQQLVNGYGADFIGLAAGEYAVVLNHRELDPASGPSVDVEAAAYHQLISGCTGWTLDVYEHRD